MKTHIKNLFLLPALIAGLGFIPAGGVTAQTFTNLHHFTGSSDGAGVYAGVIISGDTLYGTANSGGSSGHGTVFAVNTDGTGFTNLYNFTGGGDGGDPLDGGLILSGSTLYGTTTYGGGTVFAINTDGTGFTNLHSFTGSDGSGPLDGGLILSGSTLYGTVKGGGNSGNGAVFAVKTDGTGFTNLYHFTGGSDGGSPQAGLILSGNTLYGTTRGGGSFGYGTAFAINTNGTSFTNLHSFTGSDGYEPVANLILSGNTLFGTTEGGGSSGQGTVFFVKTDGTSFTNLYHFTGGGDGANPDGSLIVLGNSLYGTTTGGGSSGLGTMFKVNTDGTGFTNLHSFTGSGGATPYAGLILSGNILYGTTIGGGSSSLGTVFSLSLPVSPPVLSIVSVGNQSVLFWPTSATNYILQSTTNLASPNWVTATDAVPVIAVTITNTSPARFFRLMQP